jgi:putative Mn2+ efflux pump MntP
VTELLLVAAALGVSNLAVAIGIGVSGVRPAVRLRVALVFGLFEAGMPVLGVLAGRGAASALGGAARLTGGLLLVAVGCYQVFEWYRESRHQAAESGDSAGADASRGWSTWRLVVSGLALSLDNFVVGFALGSYHVGLAMAALVIGVVSVGMSLLGLEAGAKLGAAFGRLGTLIGGVILVAVGIAVAAGWF